MEGADWCDDANVSTAFSTQWQILYHAFQRQMQPKTSSCLPSCAHICEEWWILEDGLYDKVSITDKAMQFKQMFDRLLPLQRLWRHGTAIRSYASFIVSRSTRLSSIQVAARELTSLCMCVDVFVADAASARLLLATVPYVFSARGGAASRPAARETRGCGRGRSHNKNRAFCSNISVSKYTPF